MDILPFKNAMSHPEPKSVVKYKHIIYLKKIG